MTCITLSGDTHLAAFDAARSYVDEDNNGRHVADVAVNQQAFWWSYETALRRSQGFSEGAPFEWSMTIPGGNITIGHIASGAESPAVKVDNRIAASDPADRQKKMYRYIPRNTALICGTFP
jgi:hypothetical protein